MLVAVNASAQSADRAVFMTRLRALTATARSALSRTYVMADVEWLTLTTNFWRAYSADISLMSADTSLRIANAERAVSVTSP